MNRLRLAMAALALVLMPALAQAQDFGVMESAETIDPGNWKLKGNPMFILRDNDTDTGIVGGVGYGVNRRFDVEFNVAGYDGITHFGGNGEYWFVRTPALSLSGLVGAHYSNFSAIDQYGVDLTLIATHPVTPRLDLNAALDVALMKFKGDFPDDGYNLVHLVPGIEYRLAQDLDLLGEFGVSLNDNGNHYLSVGLAYYIR